MSGEWLLRDIVTVGGLLLLAFADPDVDPTDVDVNAPADPVDADELAEWIDALPGEENCDVAGPDDGDTS